MKSRSCYKFDIRGLVQGVGFRPFVYKIALNLGLRGEIYNDSEGVKLTLLATDTELETFFKEFWANLPPLARIDEIKKLEISYKNFENFSIVSSKQTQKIAPILSDFAICDDCKREFYDPKNPRFHYPFINCTNCGPRISIIKTLPYDRKNTTMSEFTMCKFCQNEYENPLNRRFHAQPISCPNCGPRITLLDKNGNIVCKDEPELIAQKTATLLKNGKIFAIKGLSGFHIVCDAFNQKSIQTLRVGKNRPQKPFALMCKDLQMAEQIAEISPLEAKILQSQIKPIVILKLKKTALIPPNLAPNLDKIAIFLPPTALHLLLFEYFSNPIIATSANISGEPILFKQEQIYEKLSGIIDFCLNNNREILTPSDDSIVQIIDDKVQYLRTSRSVNPKIMPTNFKQNGTFLALGAELKNQFVIFSNSNLFISPYIGDLKNIATFERFCALLKLFEKTYDLRFDEIISDLHPNFIHTKFFEKNGFNVRKIQHHKAHVWASVFEHKLQNEKFLSFCFDGTGYAKVGDNSEILGGEVFIFDKGNIKRVLNFDKFRLISGENSIKNIYKIAYSLIKKYNLENEAKIYLSRLNCDELKMLDKIYENNALLKCSSVGRIFDAFASIICGLNQVNFDGQAGMYLEALYDEKLNFSYKFEIQHEKIYFKNAVKSALNDEPKIAATGFINAFANLILEISLIYKLPVNFCGGVFQNKTLLNAAISLLKKHNIKYYFNKFPPNDSSIALGQMCAFLSNFNDLYITILNRRITKKD